MHFPIVGISYLVVLTATVSTSYEVSHFHWVKSDNGDVLCATSPPNKTLNAVESRAQCVALCSSPPCSPSTCQNVNYWTNARRCELFDYLPSYDVQQDCANYQVTVKRFSSLQNHKL